MGRYLTYVVEREYKKFRLEGGNLEKFFQRHWRCTGMGCPGPREMGQSPSLELFRNHGDVALRGVVSGHSGDGLVAGFGALRGFFQP